MNLNLNDAQMKLLLEIVAIAHTIEFMKGKDNSKIEELIVIMSDELSRLNKKYIFESVFKEHK